MSRLPLVYSRRFSGGVPHLWDSYFTETMTVLDVYHFGTQQFLHQDQLTL